jgi:predicted N-acyltransferase
MTEVMCAPLRARSIASIHDVDSTEWDACAGIDIPFLRHAFLSCLLLTS